MVVHKTVSPNSDSRRVCVCLEDPKIKSPVLIAEEDNLASTSALNDVMWAMGNDDSGDPAHMIIQRNGRLKAVNDLRIASELKDDKREDESQAGSVS
jgi:hypothetical protein